MKQVVYAAAALKDLKVYGNMRSRVVKAISEYAEDRNAHANQIKQPAGFGSKRLRLGEFRVLFHEIAESITVVKVRPRGNVYD